MTEKTIHFTNVTNFLHNILRESFHQFSPTDSPTIVENDRNMWLYQNKEQQLCSTDSERFVSQ